LAVCDVAILEMPEEKVAVMLGSDLNMPAADMSASPLAAQSS